jgi:erythromycin esterase
MRSCNLLVLGALLLSCAAPQRRSPSPSPSRHRISGVVVSDDGHAASDAIVIASDPETADEIAVAHADPAGRFSLESSAAKFSLAAATKHGWAFVPDAGTRRTDLRVQLNRNCVSLRGQVELDDPRPWPKLGVVEIGGFSPNVLGLFGAEVADDFSFEACLPPGEYYIVLPPSFAERTVLTMVPPVAPLKVRAATRAHARAAPSGSLGIGDESQAEMVANLQGSVRVLGLGESNHGTSDYMTERVDLAIALARQHQFSIIMIEAAYGEALALDRYIKGADTPIHDAIGDLGYWMWNTKDFLAALDKLRAYNAEVSAAARITILGIDIQSTEGALAELTRDRSDSLSDPAMQTLQRLADQKGKAWLAFTAEDKALTRTTLEQLAASRDAGGIESPRNRRALAARALLLRLELLEQEGFWNQRRSRDLGMARMVSEVLSLDGRLRGSLWVHLAHLSREDVVGATTMGGHLAAALGDGYQVWALLGFEGAARARSLLRNGAVVDHILSPAPEYSVEAVLSRSETRGLAVGYWDLHRNGSGENPWLHGLHWLREIGAHVLQNRGPFDLHDLSALDGIVLFRHISPSVPLSPTSSAPTKFP